jgi:valyl-tRNA synthetase
MHAIDAWILSKFGKLVSEVERSSNKYRFDQSMASIEDFLWHEFADHYIELAKHRAYGDKDEGAKYALYTVGLGLLKLISIFLPNVAEDAYQLSFKEHEKPISVHLSEWPDAPEANEVAERKGETIKELVASVRSWKSAKGLSLNAEIKRVEIVGPEAAEIMAGSEDDIRETLKAEELEVRGDVVLNEAVSGVKPVHSKLGPRFRKDAKEIAERISSMRGPGLKLGDKGIQIRMNDGREIMLTPEFFEVEKKVTSDKGELEHFTAGGLSVLVYR